VKKTQKKKEHRRGGRRQNKGKERRLFFDTKKPALEREREKKEQKRRATKESRKIREKRREKKEKKHSKRKRRKTQERQATGNPVIYQHMAEIFHPRQHLYFRPSFTSIQGGTRELCLSALGFIFCKQELQFLKENAREAGDRGNQLFTST